MHARLVRLASPAVLILFACGDAGTGEASTGGTSTDTGSSGSSSSTGAPPTTTLATTGGGQTGGQTTGATDDTGLGPTTSGTASTGGTSTGGSTSAGASTGDTTGDTTGDATTGEPVAGCLDGDDPVDAPLCGDGGPACVLLRDELVSAEAKFRNDMPAIALRGDCGPAVLYSVAVGDYFGFYAERAGADAWVVEPTPMKVATGSLEAVPAADEMLAAVDDGAFGVSVWRRSGGVWTQHSALAGMNHTRAPQLVRDGADRLHLGHVDDAGNMRHAVHDGGWTTEALLEQTEVHVRVALGPGDAPHLFGWSSVGMTWQLHHVAPPAPPEVVADLGSNVLDRHHTGVVLVGAEATPMVLLTRKQVDQVHHDLVLARRTGPATWALETLLAEDAAVDVTCDAPPTEDGQICAYDYRRVHAAALLASATEVRALYVEIHYKGALVGACEAFPQPFCAWEPMTDESTAALRVAWPGADPAEHQDVADDVFTDRMTGRLDAAGGMHLAFYSYPPAGGDPVVRYVQVGAP